MHLDDNAALLLFYLRIHRLSFILDEHQRLDHFWLCNGILFDAPALLEDVLHHCVHALGACVVQFTLLLLGEVPFDTLSCVCGRQIVSNEICQLCAIQILIVIFIILIKDLIQLGFALAIFRVG